MGRARKNNNNGEQWRLVWCHEKCHKVESEAIRDAMNQACERFQMSSVYLRKAKHFGGWIERVSRPPFVLITDWREVQACWKLIEQHIGENKPSTTIVLCDSGRQYQHASGWARSMEPLHGSDLQVFERSDIPMDLLCGLVHQIFAPKISPMPSNQQADFPLPCTSSNKQKSSSGNSTCSGQTRDGGEPSDGDGSDFSLDASDIAASCLLQSLKEQQSRIGSNLDVPTPQVECLIEEADDIVGHIASRVVLLQQSLLQEISASEAVLAQASFSQFHRPSPLWTCGWGGANCQSRLTSGEVNQYKDQSSMTSAFARLLCMETANFDMTKHHGVLQRAGMGSSAATSIHTDRLLYDLL